MRQRDSCAIRSCAGLALLIWFSTAVSAQETSVVQSPAVTAAAAAGQVRFISFDQITHVRLEVFSPTGERLFDSGFKSGDLLDWGLRDQQGQQLADGSYLCVVTVKDLSGRLSQRHGLVSLREQQVSLQRVAPEQLSAGAARAWADSRATQSLGMAQENGSLALIGEESPATMTVATHDGTDGQVTSTAGALTFRTGDLFSGKEREQMRVTPEGRVGIGTATPEDTLDVAGTIRARGGIRFDDGTVLTSAHGVALKRSFFSATAPAADSQTAAAVSGTGTANKLSKWLDGAGTLGDSVVTELNGNVGIGTASPNPNSVLHVNRSQPTGTSLFVSNDSAGATALSSLRAGLNPNDYAVDYTSLNVLGAGWTPGVGGAFLKPKTGLLESSGSNFGIGNLNNTEPIIFYTTAARLERMRLTAAGNLGVGTTAPAQRLEVVGNLLVSGAGNGLIFPDGTKQTTAATGGSGGGVSGSGTTGRVPLWSGTTALGDSVIFEGGGNIGVGTPAIPTARLRVAGLIDNTFGGIKFPDGSVQTTATVQGPAGPPGPQGPQGTPGPQGPAGPVVTSVAVCVSADAVNGRCQARTCSCPNGAMAISPSPCRVTSDTGTCSANSCETFSPSSSANGMCCVCKP